jgi:flavin reductase (DIM6/NTAB) family NADH-FMN oxidoreductase RutF
MHIDPSALSARDVYQLLIGLVTPRPIAWVSSVSAEGSSNLAPFSFFSAVTANPPTVLFSVANTREGRKKDTLLNVEAVPEFVVNLCSYDTREAMNDTSAELDYGVSEFSAFGLTPLPSETVRPPRVAESKVQLECVVTQIVRVGEGALAGNVVFGMVKRIHAQDDIFDSDGAVDPRKLDTIGRMGGSGYVRTTDLFFLPRPTRTGK